MSKIATREQMNNTVLDRMGQKLRLTEQDCSRKSHSMTIHEQQTRVINSYEQYFPFILMWKDRVFSIQAKARKLEGCGTNLSANIT
jgi:hypothetical protein